jgi:acyl transferase domain-containing protein/acyl carrier protein/protein-L-isoaspartate O-methyltransferase
MPFADRIARLSPKRLALLAMDLESRLTAPSPAGTAIAVVGIGCRLPGGVCGPEDFWTLLREGRDAITEVPADRWPIADYFDPDPDVPGRMSTRFGGFLDDIRGFDAEFFGISPREAAAMDPQQRIFLEVAWEALEHAGISPDGLKGSATGVFAGVCNADYYQRLSALAAPARDAYVATGNAGSVVSGRVAYVLGLHGPAVSVDTACSSSLVAVHLACQSLRLNETHVALAGGVNVICAPHTTVLLSKAHMMAPDGRCKTFDRRADGFVRAEGCGIVVLKRLTDAVADGDRILAVIRGSAINQDGRSSGLTAPNGPSQEAVIRGALAAAAIAPHEVGYVETHGTGTALGDPIEVRALTAVLTPGRDADRPLTIGSVKTNIGHLESAAGIAGLIKAALVLHHHAIPAHLHLGERNPHIDWNASIAIPHATIPWPEAFTRRVAGVSSFGFSGTNAHVVLEAAAAEESAAAVVGAGRRLLALSARSEPALTALADRFDRVMSITPPDAVDDLCRTMKEGRAQLPNRLAVTGSDLAQLRDNLASWRRTSAHRDVHARKPPSGPPDVVLLFSGQGSQYAGMGRGLYESQQAFRAALDECARVMEPGLPALRELLLDEARLQETAYAQPALFAVEYAAARMWMAWGIRPAAVLGHSLGEITAACIAGVLTLEHAARLVIARGRIMQQLPSGGRMAAVFADESTVRDRLVGEAVLAIAAVNAPGETVVSGDGVALERWCRARAEEGIEARLLRSAHAFHSPLIEPILDALQHAADDLVSSPARVPLLSNLTGRPLGPNDMDASYWRAHARQPVRFADALRSLDSTRPCVFLEVGPGTTLLSLVRRAAPVPQATLLATMRSGRDEADVCVDSLAAIWSAGVAIDWPRVDAGGTYRRLALPRYPFQREAHWLQEAPPSHHVPPATPAAAPEPLPGRRLATAVPVFEIELTADRLAAMPVHVVADRRMVAAAFFVEAMYAAVTALDAQPSVTIADLAVLSPLTLDATPRRLQVVVAADTVQIFSAPAGDAEWVLHAQARRVEPEAAVPVEPAHREQARGRCSAEWTSADLRARLAALDIDPGAAIGRLERIWRRDGEAVARIDASDAASRWTAMLVDAAMMTIAAAAPQAPAERSVVSSLGRVVVGEPGHGPLWVHVTVEPDGGALVAHLRVTGDDGRERLRMGDIRLGRLANDRPRVGRPSTYAVVWREQALPESAEAAGDSSADTYQRLAQEHGLDSYAQLAPLLDELATEYARAALTELGVLDSDGRLDLDRMDRVRAQVAPAQQVLFEYLTRWMEHAQPSPRRDIVMAHLAATYPQFAAELQLIGRCGPRLADALRGAVGPLDLLFGDPDLLPCLYEKSPSARFYNTLLADEVARRCRAARGRRVRVLEIGAGTGATTASLLPRLDPGTTRYLFTDVSPAFLARARREFSQYDFVEFSLFDAERDGQAQGLAPGSFDIIVAANVLHATGHLREALTHVRDLLAPGGSLLLIEGTAPQRWIDITFGLSEGWWRFVDRDPSRRYPLIGADAWRDLLTELGLGEIVTLPGRPEASSTGQVIITARAPGGSGRRSWVVVADADPLAVDLVRQVARGGDTGVHVASIDDPTLDELPPNNDTRVVLLEPMRPAAEPVAAALEACTRLTEWLSHARERWASVTVHVVTRGAQPVEPGQLVRPDQASLWGLGAVAALEEPDAWGGLIDLDPQGSVAEASTIVAEVVTCREDRVAYRRGRRLVPRLVKHVLAPPAPSTLDTSGSWLITGGLGAVGSCSAEWLAERGVTHLVLLSRSGLTGLESGASGRVVDALTGKGVQVEVVSTDVSDGLAVARLMRGFGTVWPQLSGVVHAAGVFESRSLATIEPEHFHTMFAGKAAGAWNIVRHLPDSASQVILCSSTASIVGGTGQGAYAAANALLDALAHSGEGRVRPLSVNWGLWQAMRGVPDDVRRHYAAIGFHEMAPDTALAAMEAAMASGAAQCCVAAMDWRRFRNTRQARRPQPLLSELDAVPEAAAVRRVPQLRELLEHTDPRERHAVVLERVRGHIAVILQLRSPDAVPVDRGLFELGMDSLMAVELTRRLEGDLGAPLTSTVTFNYPNARALASYLLEMGRSHSGHAGAGHPRQDSSTGVLR